MKVERIRFDGFDWDIGNFIKATKHGVSVEEIESIFSERLLYFEDVRHSQMERRFIAVGETTKQRALFIAFTFRNRDREVLIRVISARYTHTKERRIYEEIKKNILKK